MRCLPSFRTAGRIQPFLHDTLDWEDLQGIHSSRNFVTPASPLSNPSPIESRSNPVVSRFYRVKRSTAIGNEIRSGSRSYNRNWRGPCAQGCRSNQGRTGRRDEETIAPCSRHLGCRMLANARLLQQRTRARNGSQ